MPVSARPNIVLIGFMGSGKSSVGRRIAARTAYRFADTDQLVIQKTGLQIADLFHEKGEPYFRDEETAALEALRSERGQVIATGGGIVLRPANIQLLRQLGFVVWLLAGEEAIYARVSRNKRRPLVQTADPRGTIRELLEQRRPLYESAAQFTIDTSERSHDEIAEAILVETARRFGVT